MLILENLSQSWWFDKYLTHKLVFGRVERCPTLAALNVIIAHTVASSQNEPADTSVEEKG